MEKYKKYIIIAIAMVLITVLTFGTFWITNNWGEVRDGLGGADLYTRADVENAFNDGQSQGQLLREQLEAQVRSLSTIVENLNNTLSELTDALGQNTTLVEQLQSQLRSMESLIEYYQRQIDNLLNQNNQVLVSFVVDGELLNSLLVPINTTIHASSVPSQSDIHIVGFYFAGWSKDGLTIIDIPSITITETISFFAVIRAWRVVGNFEMAGSGHRFEGFPMGSFGLYYGLRILNVDVNQTGWIDDRVSVRISSVERINNNRFRLTGSGRDAFNDPTTFSTLLPDSHLQFNHQTGNFDGELHFWVNVGTWASPVQEIKIFPVSVIRI